MAATAGVVTRVARPGTRGVRVGRIRTPRFAIACATEAIPSVRREHLELADRRRPHLERAHDLPGGGQRARTLAAQGRGLVEPVALGHLHQPLRRRPSPRAGRTPSCRSGRSCSRTCRRRARRSRSPAPHHRSRPCSPRRTCRCGLTSRPSSAAVVVTILNVEPGGCGAEIAIPASARILAVRASSAATPPSLPASAVTAACCSRLSIVATAGRDGRGVLTASTRSSAFSSPPGVPSNSRWKARSRPETPTGVSRSKPRAKSSRRSRRSSLSATDPAIDAPVSPSGDVRASAGPSASTLASADRIRARSGTWLRRDRDSLSPDRGARGVGSNRPRRRRPAAARGHRGCRRFACGPRPVSAPHRLPPRTATRCARGS